MKKEEISPEFFEKILECIMVSLTQNGFKATTMDSIAAKLQMSKRTLYEIFGSKEDMFLEAHKYFHQRNAQKLKEIFDSSENIMEAIIRSFLYNRDLMSRVSASFIRDIEQFASYQNYISDTEHRHLYQNLCDVLNSGMKEGYFREDLNLAILCRMLLIQMEALKRTPELFSEDISLLEVYDNIIIGFLRGISSPKGLEELEKYMPALTSLTHVQHNEPDF